MADPSTSSVPVELCRTTAALHARIASLTSAAKAGHPLAPVTLVVDSAYAGTLLRRQLVASGAFGEGTANLRLATLPELITDLAERLGIAGSSGVPRIVGEAVVGSLLAASPGPFEEIREHPSTAVRLADVVGELDWCTLDPASLAAAREVASTTTLSVLDFVGRVRDELAATCSVRPLAAVAAETTAACADPSRVPDIGTVIVLAQTIPSEALALLGALAVAGEVVVLDLEPDTIGDPAQVLDCPDPGTEVALAVRYAAQAIAEGTPPDQVALLYGSSAPYSALLAAELDSAGLTWHGPAAGSLASTALARATTTLLAMASARTGGASGITRPLLLRWISSAPVRDGDAPRRTWAWRRLVRDQKLYADSAGWRTALDALVAAAHEPPANPDADEAELDRAREAARRTADSAQALLTGLDDLGAALDLVLGAVTWRELGERLWAVLEQFHIGGGWWRRHDSERAACERIRAVLLDELPGLDLVAVGAPVDPTARVEALAQLLGRDLLARRGRVGDMGSGIHVGPVTGAATHRFARVVVLGAAEGLLPPLVTEDPLLPDAVRAALRAAPADLATTTERVGRVRTAYAAVVGSAEHAVVTFPRAAVAGHRNLPMSRFLHGIPVGLAQRVDSRASTLRVPEDEGSPLPLPVTPSDLVVLGLLTSGEVPADLVAARDAAVAGARVEFDRFHGNLEGIDDIGVVWRIGDRALSASAIESFLHCPYHFFVQRVLGVGTDAIVDEIDEAGAADVGTLLHEALERFVESSRDHGTLPAAGDPWPDGAAEALTATFDDVVADAEERGLLGWAPAWARRYRVIVESFDSLLEVDASEVRGDPALRPEATERRFGFDGDPLVEVTLDDGSVVSLRGAIDRLDVGADGTAVGVVDYKSGRSATFKDMLGIPKRRGAIPRREKVQDLVYDAAARVLHPGATDIKVSFVFVPDTGTVTAVVADHVDDRPAALKAQLEALAEAGRSGRFVPRPGGTYDYCPVCTAMGRQATRAAEAAGIDVDEDAGEGDGDD